MIFVYEADDLLDELVYEQIRQTVEQTGKFREAALNQIPETTSILDFEVEGREAEVLEILKLVIDSSDEDHTSVLSIVGMGGLGKTTLAKMVFNHDATEWVCVSKPFIVVKILEAIFEGLTNTSSGLNSREALLNRLPEEMREEKSIFLYLTMFGIKRMACGRRAYWQFEIYCWKIWK
ncbi:hypothetical protein IC575_024437 [Cucumis melo]